MSEAKPYTPGPWEVAHAGQGVFGGKFQITEYFVRLPGADFALASDITDAAGVPSEANARLMAAAPEMLEALQEAVALADRNCPVWDGQPHRTPECKATYDKCVAAIRKATGASHV